MNTSINSRTRIEIRWSTNPNLVGYAPTAERRDKALAEFSAATPDFVGTPRQVFGYWRKVKNNIGGAFSRVNLRTRTTKIKVSWEDLDHALAAKET
jgi:hypothetical protein